jgi:hypothetical protein
MRTLLRLASCVAILIASAAPVRAQGIFDRIKKKATDAVTQKAEDKVDAKIDEMSQRMVDNSFAAMFGDPAATTGAKGGNGGAGGNGGGASGASAGGSGGAALPFSIGGNAKTESVYSFNVVTTMEIESSKQAGKAVLTTLLNTSEPYVGMKIVSPDDKKASGTAFVVLDSKNQAMVMLMSTDTSKFSMAYSWANAQKYAPPPAASAPPPPPVNWDTVKVWKSYTRIGTKTIAGYAADGYRMESPDGVVEVWVSRDHSLAGGGMFGASSELKQMKGRLPADYPQGMLLQMTSANSKSGEKVSMTVTNIDTNAHVSYAMSDYPKMGSGKK